LEIFNLFFILIFLFFQILYSCTMPHLPS
jgi:hypothetical protein